MKNGNQQLRLLVDKLHPRAPRSIIDPSASLGGSHSLAASELFVPLPSRKRLMFPLNPPALPPSQRAYQSAAVNQKMFFHCPTMSPVLLKTAHGRPRLPILDFRPSQSPSPWHSQNSSHAGAPQDDNRSPRRPDIIIDSADKAQCYRLHKEDLLEGCTVFDQIV